MALNERSPKSAHGHIVKACQAPTTENPRQTPTIACPISFVPQAILDRELKYAPNASSGHTFLIYLSSLERGLYQQDF
jgi:hypothetical protein